MLKRGSLAVAVLGLCALAYLAAPFHTAWAIRSAAKAGDGAYLAQKIEWASIRPGLKVSLTQIALGPKAVSASTSGAEKLGIWQRVKNYSTRLFIHGFVDRYANPDGFETLMSYGRVIRDTVDAASEADEAKLPIWQRVANVWSRVRRAEFKSLSQFEMDMVDKDDPNRLYSGVFNLRDWQWKLVDLSIRQLPNGDQSANGGLAEMSGLMTKLALVRK